MTKNCGWTPFPSSRLVVGVIATLTAVLSCSALTRSAPADTQPASQATRAEAATSESAEGNVLVCENPVYDFGTIWAGDVIYHEFEVKNTGSQTVWVEAIRTGGTHPRRIYRIDPHGTVKIPVRVDKQRWSSGERIVSYNLKVVPPPDE